MARPRLLLMDEPSVGLAPRVVETLIETTLACARAGSRSSSWSRTWAWPPPSPTTPTSRDGVIAYSGPARALVDNEEVLASYLGR